MKAGIMGLDFLRTIFLRRFSLRLLVPLVRSLMLASLPLVLVVLGLSGSDSLWKPLWPFVARGVVMASRCRYTELRFEL